MANELCYNGRWQRRTHGYSRLDWKLKSLHRSHHHPIQSAEWRSRWEIQITKLTENFHDEKDEINRFSILTITNVISIVLSATNIFQLESTIHLVDEATSQHRRWQRGRRARRQFVISSNGWEYFELIQMMRYEAIVVIRFDRGKNWTNKPNSGVAQIGTAKRTRNRRKQLVFI